MANAHKPKLLALGPQNVFPPTDGGKEGIFGALRALSAHFDVSYAFPAEKCLVNLSGYSNAGIRALPAPYAPIETLPFILQATLQLRPFKFQKYSTRAAVQAYCQIIPIESYSLVLCFHAHTWRLGDAIRRRLNLDSPVIVREHNIEYEIVNGFRDSQKGGRRVVASLFAWLTRREEMRIWHQADAIAFLSDKDLRTAQTAAGSASSNFVLAREGVPLPPRRSAQYPAAQAPLLVLLNPRALQSVVNLRDFVHRYWLPLREQRRLDNEVLHVSGVADEQLSQLIELDVANMSAAGIRGIGFLPSLKPALESALALVSPTFIGGGIRKKVLEAMAHQLPVIATDLDIECCDYFKPNQNILSLGDPDNFAHIVRKLRTDEAYWLNLSSQARDTVEEFANWERFGDTMSEVVKQMNGFKRS
jgi:glycosyltransferase involved in cell wall biosynthesis